MPDQDESQRTAGRGAVGGGPDIASSSLPADAGSSAERLDLTADQVRRWARLVADGAESFPQGLGPGQERAMLDEVRRLRRTRLVRLIAGQVARDFLSRCDDDRAGRQGGRQR
jgi:hypothetical protein